ncbi:hypothetical protein I7I50_02541 [Histoplasma capsulatum G186AR]|uniref:Uncharacterized protein n=1 Tax=Ajellomyces capsulatus TaxID=5037 RepID=A0A8H8D6N8_AJECA|nr:hypothetical protein I7I52_00796 [Histoplasma capsulatum]QSS71626.1 hypothetical protein I7I50_02541 [Histoplasma capsulatum G186AR]
MQTFLRPERGIVAGKLRDIPILDFYHFDTGPESSTRHLVNTSKNQTLIQGIWLYTLDASASRARHSAVACSSYK